MSCQASAWEKETGDGWTGGKGGKRRSELGGEAEAEGPAEGEERAGGGWRKGGEKGGSKRERPSWGWMKAEARTDRWRSG